MSKLNVRDHSNWSILYELCTLVLCVSPFGFRSAVGGAPPVACKQLWGSRAVSPNCRRHSIDVAQYLSCGNVARFYPESACSVGAKGDSSIAGDFLHPCLDGHISQSVIIGGSN